MPHYYHSKLHITTLFFFPNGRHSSPRGKDTTVDLWSVYAQPWVGEHQWQRACGGARGFSAWIPFLVSCDRSSWSKPRADREEVSPGLSVTNKRQTLPSLTGSESVSLDLKGSTLHTITESPLRASLHPRGHWAASGDASKGFSRGQGAPSGWWGRPAMPQGTGCPLPLGRARPGRPAAAPGLGDPDAPLRSEPRPANTVRFPLRSACVAGT